MLGRRSHIAQNYLWLQHICFGNNAITIIFLGQNLYLISTVSAWTMKQIASVGWLTSSLENNF